MKFKFPTRSSFIFLCMFYHTTGYYNHNVEELGAMHIIRDHLTLSGFSSGGTFAQILQFSYSSIVQGVAVFSHTFYRCGYPNGDFTDWDRVCTRKLNTSEADLYDPELVHQDIKQYFQKGLIENPNNLRNKRLYVYTGLRNFLFSPAQSMNILRVYERYIRNPYKIKTRVQDATFVMPTNNNFGPECTQDASSSHFIGNCGFSGAYEALKFLHCDHFKIFHPTMEKLFLQPLRSFNQSVFLDGLLNHQMDEIGFYYVPTRCQDFRRPCLLHVFFHGCGNNRKSSGESFIGNSGFLEVAEANDIIMLFPQNNPLPVVGTMAEGCWDTFGLGGTLYATQKGEQVQAVWRIIMAIMGGYPKFRPNNFRLPPNIPY